MPISWELETCICFMFGIIFLLSPFLINLSFKRKSKMLGAYLEHYRVSWRRGNGRKEMGLEKFANKSSWREEVFPIMMRPSWWRVYTYMLQIYITWNSVLIMICYDKKNVLPFPKYGKTLIWISWNVNIWFWNLKLSSIWNNDVFVYLYNIPLFVKHLMY